MPTRPQSMRIGGMQLLDGRPRALVHSAEEGAGKLADTVENTGARIARGAEHAGQALGHAAKGAGWKPRSSLPSLPSRASLPLVGGASGKTDSIPSKADAMVKAQLAKTSRELAHESSDLSAAVDSLNHIIRANRRAAARGRTRMLGGLAIGALLTYHLDPQHGRERRAATVRLLTRVARGL